MLACPSLLAALQFRLMCHKSWYLLIVHLSYRAGLASLPVDLVLFSAVAQGAFLSLQGRCEALMSVFVPLICHWLQLASRSQLDSSGPLACHVAFPTIRHRQELSRVSPSGRLLEPDSSTLHSWCCHLTFHLAAETQALWSFLQVDSSPTRRPKADFEGSILSPPTDFWTPLTTEQSLWPQDVPSGPSTAAGHVLNFD